ncbi:MAG: hypothetical protein NC177_01620 [Ruminococcus flavefaciens]|nr:hypothetical protein [Ruminococcus flavefaciens]
MKTKKILSALTAVSLIAGAVPVMNASAVNNEPRVYVDITYDENDNPMANIMFENTYDVASGGFHLDLGDGWKAKLDEYGDVDIKGTRISQKFSPMVKTDTGNDLFVAFSANNNYTFNGLFFSIYLEKTENFNEDNAEINVVFKSSKNVYDYIANRTNSKKLITAETDNAPTMIKAYEYLVGDVNNDGYVDAIDSTMILCALEDNNRTEFSVDEIKHSYKSYFPEAVCPASPDASQDNTISELDSDLIMQYYMDMSTSGVNNSRVGKIDFYELFED